MTRIELNSKYPWMKDTELFQHANGEGWIEHPDRVHPTARIEGLVYGNAQVYGDARVYGNARVGGDARVYGNARVGGDALVDKATGLYTFGPIGSRNEYTSYASKTKTIMCGCFVRSLDEFAAAVDKTHSTTAHGDNYRALITLFKTLSQ